MATQTDRLNDRYGDQPQPDHMQWNEQIAALLAHRSVRSFTAEPLPDGALEAIVAAAQSASTSSNLHQWSVVAVAHPTTEQELARLTRGATTGGGGYAFVADAPMVLVWIADMSRNHAIAVSRGEDPAAVDFLDAFLMASVDAALAAQNGMVAAESLGLGGVYLGSLRNHSEEVADLLGLPSYAYVVFGTAVGVPDPLHPSAVRPRPPQHAVLHRERYGRVGVDDWLEGYEAATLAFRTDNGLRQKTWAEAVSAGIAFDYMDGREHLRATLEKRGYGLR